MINNQKKAIIFDFGNVIAFFDYNRVVDNFAKLGGNALPHDLVKSKIFASSLLAEFEQGSLPTADFIKEIRQRLGLHDISDKKIIDAWCDLFTPNKKITTIIHNIPADITLILGSTTNPLHFEYYRRVFSDTLNRFKSFVTSFAVGALKPSPVFYERCLLEAQCKPSECIYVDDMPQYMEAAAKLGIAGIVYNQSVDLVAKLREQGIVI